MPAKTAPTTRPAFPATAQALPMRAFCYLATLSLLALPPTAAGQARTADPLDLSATRPTIANSAAVQAKGVLQVETGYDAYPQTPPGDQQAISTSAFYTPWSRARLDFGWSTFSYVSDPNAHATGVGTLQLGTKLIFVRDRPRDHTRHGLPGLGLQYEAELPTASAHPLQGYGQQLSLLANHLVGKVNFIVNGSVVQTYCQTRAGCTIGGQQAIALSYHQSPHTSLYAEVFAQNVSQANSPPGTYVFGGFLHRFSDRFGIDGGLRFGVSNHSATIGTTVGLLFGRRLRAEPPH